MMNREAKKHVAGRSAYNYYYKKKLVSEHDVIRRIYYPPLRNVVAWYPCSEGGGTIVHDRSSRLNHLSPGYPAGVPTWRFVNGSPCLYFDGSPVNEQTLTPVGTTGKITVACHMISEVNQAGNLAVPFSRTNAWSLQFDHAAAQYRGAFAVCDTFGGWYTSGGPNLITPNVEHHFAGTYDGDILSMYLDRKLLRSAVVGKFTVDIGPADKTFIGWDSPPAIPWRGTIRDCITAFDCYSPDEIRRLADSHV